MESFSLLKFWRGAAAAAASPLPAAADTIPNAVALNDVETDDDSVEGDDGPFFDLEFTLPDDSPQYPNDTASHNSEEEEEEDSTSDDDDDEGEDSVSEVESEIKFTLSPSTNDRSSDQVLVTLDPNSTKPPPHQFTASVLKSATKLRAFNLGLKKPKPNSNPEKDPIGSDPNPKQRQQPRKQLFTVKFKVEEVPIMLKKFTKDHSSKFGGKSVNKDESQTLSSVSEEKRLVLRKYLRLVKPLYVRVSRRYADKLRFSGQINVNDSATAAEKEGDAVVAEAAAGTINGKGQSQRQGLRIVCKHLGKSRSASSVEEAAAAAELVSSRRRDDSLLQREDGIQGAILHCKRSFNGSRESKSSSQLPRSVSDPLHEVSAELSKRQIYQ